MNQRCRLCERPEPELVLSLGTMPLANALLTPDRLGDAEPTYPLDLVFCPGCSLLQITETIPPQLLFRDYAYFSSYSETLLRHVEALANRLVEARRLDGGSLVVEVASNDGYLLQYYRRRGVSVLGIEPAVNIARVAETQQHISTICEFFDEGLARRLRQAHPAGADVIHAHNVLAHVPDLHGFVRGFRALLRDGGVVVIEVPYVKDLIDRCEFDTIYHEHLCYFSLTALARLFTQHDLAIEDVERVPIHGGSLRLFIGAAGCGRQAPAVRALLDEETGWGVQSRAFYQGFSQRVNDLKESLRDTLTTLKARQKRLAAYGAAAKATTLLNFVGIGTDLLDFVVDRSTYKQGRYIPGVRLPIHPPSRLLETMPDYVLLLAWNFIDEILKQQAEFRQRGGRFIVPIPTVQVV